jgi:glucosylceramidase
MTTTDEDTPLLAVGSGGSISDQRSRGCWTALGGGGEAASRRRLLVSALLVAAGAVLGALLSSRPPAASRGKLVPEPVLTPPQQPPPASETTTTTTTAVTYRPVCEHYSHRRTAARILRTSASEPSRPWTAVPCFFKTGSVERRRTPLFERFSSSASQQEEEEINAYGAPDAILRADFSQPAHPDKRVPILGFGGAFTEAASLNYGRLSPEGRAAAVELLFGRTGLGYSVGRLPINSCDFSVRSYSFDDTEDDFDLTDFDTNVEHNVRNGMIDMALKAQETFQQAWGKRTSSEDDVDDDGYGGERFRLFASPWSPPSWMKKPTWEDENRTHAVHASKMTYSHEPNCLREGVGPGSRYAASWARYLSKFIESHRRQHGLDLWAVTVQNEPEFAAPWEACTYTARNMSDFVAHHLGPVLQRDHPTVKILGFDHNKDHIIEWADVFFNATASNEMRNHETKHPLAAPYLAGLAYHWYAGGMDRLLDGAIGQPNMHRLQDNLRAYGVLDDHVLLGSESCHCPTTGYAGGDLNVYWARAERYAHTILADLAAGSNGWVEWNLILDGIGGPNHLGNLCEAAILAVPHRAADAPEDMPPLPDFERDKPMGKTNVGDGRTREELNALGFPAKFLDVGIAVQPMYYYMGHISRYVRPGSVAVRALVQQSVGDGRIFRPAGTVVAGGGENDLARNGIEITLWPCEGSTRQQFRWNGDSVNRYIQVLGHDWLGNPTTSCIGRQVDKAMLGMTLTDCKESKAGKFDVIPLDDDEDDRYTIRLLNPRNVTNRRQCLVVKELGNQGGAYGPRGGAQVALGNCTGEAALWKLDRETGQASSIFFADDVSDNEVCMTTGWPFLQMGAFLTPNGEAPKTVVILNEARESANFALKDGDHLVLTGSIPPKSIQTVLLN